MDFFHYYHFFVLKILRNLIYYKYEENIPYMVYIFSTHSTIV